IHRDLKPDNIMLGPFGETLVVDWGVAKIVGQSEAPAVGPGPDPETTETPEALTLPGSVVGTPCFMSPAQAKGLNERVGPASDIYSLGATLYNLLTGHVPFESGGRYSVMERIQRGQFARPRQHDPRVPRALEAICLKAMATRPEDRYASARALADDIER